MEKALFWDYDGTLVLPDTKWSNALYNAITYYNYDISINDIRSHLRAGFTWHTPEVAYTKNIGQKWWDDLFIHFDLLYKEHMVSKSNWSNINLNLKCQILDYKNYTAYADAEPVLQACMKMGYKNYILSNNFPELAFVIEGMGLSEYFTDYIISANIGYEKPRLEIFQHALSLADLPDVRYMIGDNPVADIQGGNAAGMKTVLVHHDGVFNADYKCDKLFDILLILT